MLDFFLWRERGGEGVSSVCPTLGGIEGDVEPSKKIGLVLYPLPQPDPSHC